MKTKITLHFYAKSTKPNAAGQLPIYVRLTVDGKRMEFSTKKFIDSAKWSPEMSKMKGTTEDARSLNEYLNLLKAKIFDIQMELIHQNEILTIEIFKNKLLGIQERGRMLIPIFVEHNRKMEELVGIEYAPGTLERYKTSLSHTKDFLQWKYNVSDIEISKIDHAFITEYEFYLRSVRNCANNTAVKYIKNFHKIINQCLANGWLNKDPFFNYKSKVKEVERVYLTEEEIQNIINKDFKIERIAMVRDIFIFSCFTGLAYVDVKQLTKNHISLGIDGDKWIFKNRQKTDTTSKIPLLPMAMEIVDKYKNHPTCINENRLLPILSNQKMNAYLKEIADVCEINKELTFHIARHTFATTVTLSNGVPIETVSKMLGHTNLKTTQHYAKILDKKISNDMMILKEKFKNTNQMKLGQTN
ncbi:site-specific integrase [Flavobacterium gawalongense]|uniref:Site-specific integrase n=1 Tax=Flavobacterium gawalongense TaxID=2594432 RepID=A0A553BDD0_9FLAO|nr:site-specific integrase [Flavobacterium gawalongense]TRX01337.1 site-specific integrase [Flavobacterium gawalongense]TRX05861.1 site-specific integrase [Flavobacterium gawalongense]TRX06247.1 site-specific integrase [Flavobacterium gawalongense]TRX06991.1 site-specific integrase [Flavobacterium gawalongense]TRX23120.1 site-specific integrase [Flavobacterium gawalongense]